jgi:SAM-dependent methyltransferase
MNDPQDYDSIADLYDVYVETDLDVPFFLDEAQRISGEALELMAGTGRVSIPLIEAGVPLTCVDYSAGMLDRLRAKLAARGLTADLRQMDARALDLGRQFDLILIPFHAFTEITDRDDERQALGRIRDHLSDGGRFICALHNPAVRLRSVDGQLKLWLRRRTPGRPGRLLMWLLQTHDPRSHIVHVVEFFEEYDARSVMQSKKMIEISFRLLEKAEFEDMAAEAGFVIEALYGDYDRAPFEADASPFMIWILRKQ